MAQTYARSRQNTYEQNDPFRSDYRSGHEPSAPPYYEQQQQNQRHRPPPPPHDDFDEFPHSRDGKAHPNKDPYLGPAEENETLGGYFFTRMIRPLWRGSHTVLRVDLRRSLAYDGPIFNKGGGRNRSGPSGTVASSGGRNYHDDEESQGSRGWLNGISGGGARLKIMQVWDAPVDFLGEGRRSWNINMGFGLNLELDQGVLQPKFRMKARHLALHVFPQPEVELRGKWPLGGTRLALNVKYRIPLTLGGLEDFWSSSGARLMVNFFNPLGSGFHLTPGGVEFDEHLIRLGDHTKIRFAAAMEFPRKLPLEEGEQPVKLRVHRLGVKTIIQPGVTF